MQIPDILPLFVEPLEKAGFPYMVTGSVASILYGMPRLTHDVDLVLDISAEQADIYPLREMVERWAMDNRRRLEWEGHSIWVAPPEYVVVRKLEYYAEGGSEKHLIDVKNLLGVQGDGVDLDWIRSRVDERGLVQAWQRVAPPQ